MKMYIKVMKDNTQIQKSHIYYVISRKGKCKIKNEIYDVKQGDIIEIPENTKFIFAGKMKLLLIMNTKFNKDTEIIGEVNDLY